MQKFDDKEQEKDLLPTSDIGIANQRLVCYNQHTKSLRTKWTPKSKAEQNSPDRSKSLLF